MKREDEEDEVDAEELFSHVKEMNALAHFARCQAQEADMRANYAINMADRAAAEVEAVRQIALSLTKTARSVARMSLEHINKMNSAEDRCFKLGDLSVERENRETNQTPSPRKRQQASNKSPKRSALSEDSSAHTRLIPDPDDPTLLQEKSDSSQDAGRKLEERRDNSPPPYGNLGTEFEDICDQQPHVEALQNQSSNHTGEQFIEAITDKEATEDLDSWQTLPIVFWDSYKRVRRPVDRKVRNLESAGSDEDVPNGEGE